MAVIHCPSCGKLISSSVKFCPECGKKLELPQPIEATATASAEPANTLASSAEPANAVSSAEPTNAVSSSAEPANAVSSPAETASAAVESASGTPVDAVSNVPSEDGNVSVSTPSDSGIAAEPKSKWWPMSTRRKIGVFLLLLLIAAIIGLCVADHNREANREERAYERLEGCTNLQWYEEYILEFPDGKHIAEVKKMYAEAKMEQEQFFREVDGGTREQLIAFIKMHPTSPYAQVCENRLDSLDWDDALSANSVASYAKYLELHPEGLFADQATNNKNRQAKMEVTEDEKNMLRGSIDNFLAALSSGNADQINSVIGSNGINFCGQSGATGTTVADFYNSNFHQGDILGVHFSVRGGLNIRKTASGDTDQLNYVVNADLDATLNRTSLDSTGVQTWKLSAELTPDRHLTKVTLRH